MINKFYKETKEDCERKEQSVRRRVRKLKNTQTRVKFEKRVGELVNVDAQDLWKSFKDGIQQACDELCRKNRKKV